MRRSFVLLLIPVALLAAACGSSSSKSSFAPATHATTVVMTKTLPGLGPVLVNSQGPAGTVITKKAGSSSHSGGSTY
jgi:hypothetical protein